MLFAASGFASGREGTTRFTTTGLFDRTRMRATSAAPSAASWRRSRHAHGAARRPCRAVRGMAMSAGTESLQTRCWSKADSNSGSHPRATPPAATRFVADSALEGSGFEPAVHCDGGHLNVTVKIDGAPVVTAKKGRPYGTPGRRGTIGMDATPPGGYLSRPQTGVAR